MIDKFRNWLHDEEIKTVEGITDTGQIAHVFSRLTMPLCSRMFPPLMMLTISSHKEEKKKKKKKKDD